MPRRALVTAAVLSVAVATAHAHQPTLGAEEVFVEDPTISRAVYGEFFDGDEVYTVHMTFDRGFALPFELLIPHKDPLRDHRPWYAVVAPGLPAPTAEELALLPVEVPEGSGVFVDRNDDPARDVIFESFTRRIFWSTGATALALQPGEATIAVWSPDGTVGEYVIGFGVEEDFSDGFGGVFADWATYAY